MATSRFLCRILHKSLSGSNRPLQQLCSHDTINRGSCVKDKQNISDKVCHWDVICRHISSFHRAECFSGLPAMSRAGLKPSRQTLPICWKGTRNMAGHAHWKNVKHIKEAYDAEKSAVSAHNVKLMRSIIKTGGADVKTNNELAKHMERMLKLGIPKATVQKVLAKAQSDAKNMSTHYIRVRGPSGVVIVTEIQSGNINTVKADIGNVLKKTSGVLAPNEPVENTFEMKGVITVPVRTEDIDMDHFVEVAIEAGADDVILTKNTDEDPETDQVLKFHCNPKYIDGIAKEIRETHQLEVASHEVELTPHVYVTLDREEDIAACEQIYKKLKRVESVTNFFDNISIPEE